jgi:hypothetical protein
MPRIAARRPAGIEKLGVPASWPPSWQTSRGYVTAEEGIPMAARPDEADTIVLRPDLFWEQAGQLFFVVPGEDRVFRLELGKRPLKALRKALDALENRKG